MEKTKCPRCEGPVGKQSGSHERRCRTARQWERDYFRDHGWWPAKKNRSAPMVLNHSRSRQRGVAAFKVNAAGAGRW